MSREPKPDWRAELGRHEGKAAHEALSDQITVFRVIFRIILSPIWLPIWFWKVEKRRRMMREFAMAHVNNRAIDDDLIHEIVLEWVAAHPDRYPLGEYDVRLHRLHRTFYSILNRPN